MGRHDFARAQLLRARKVRVAVMGRHRSFSSSPAPRWRASSTRPRGRTPASIGIEATRQLAHERIDGWSRARYRYGEEESTLRSLLLSARDALTKLSRAVRKGPGVAIPMGELPPTITGGGTIYGLRKRWSLSPDRRAFAVFDAALEAGSNAFDTAAIYGGGYGERTLGDWIRARRAWGRVIVIGKGGHPDSRGVSRVHPAFLEEDLHGSLRRLRVDAIDLYMLHRDDPALPVGAIMEALHRFVQAGKVLALGVSNWTHTRIEEANLYAEARGLTPFVASSPQFSLAEMHAPPWPGCISIGGAQGAEARAWYAASQMAVLAWSPLAGGFLLGRDTLDEAYARAYRSDVNVRRRERAQTLAKQRGLPLADIALAYVRGHGMKVHPIVAASTPERITSLLRATEVKLSPDEIAWLDLRAEEPCPSPS
jgi:aryl-alcohol dehydrogenase-like predicted oxidoreductase